MNAKGESLVETLPVLNQQIPVENKSLPHTSLLFYPENPRIYSIVKADSKEPDQDEIFERLSRQEHVKQLVQDIRQHGGLMDPVLVRGGSMHVLEGNSRLAAYRILAKSEPIKWGMIRCKLLPKDIDEELIFAILAQYHIKGKKDWVPYEQAGFLFRRQQMGGIDATKLAQEVGIGRNTVKDMIATYQFMIDHNQQDVTRWSYYYEYVKSRKIRKARAEHEGLDKLIVKKIESGEIEKAVDIRDKLQIICDAPPRVLASFVSEKYDFERSVEKAKDAGGDNTDLKKIEKFRMWIVSPDTEKALLRADGRHLRKIMTDLSKTSVRIKALLQRMNRTVSTTKKK